MSCKKISTWLTSCFVSTYTTEILGSASCLRHETVGGGGGDAETAAEQRQTEFHSIVDQLKLVRPPRTHNYAMQALLSLKVLDSF